MALAPGLVLAERFEIVGVLGSGGMATVYLAEDRVRDERVALKVLHAHLAGDASMRGRLRREVQVAGRIRHPHALVALDLHEDDGTLALSMPLHEGVTLQEHVDTHGPLQPAHLERIARQLVGALAEAHRRGVVHRDITPNNVMIDGDGDAVLTDFGLARFDAQKTQTATGLLGTAGFAAPEMVDGRRSDPRSDVYGLGCVLFLAATGKAPFDGANPMATLKAQLDGDHPSIDSLRSGLPAALTSTIEAMIERDPEARPQGPAEVEALLEGHRAPEPLAVRAPIVARLEFGSFRVEVRETHEDRARRNRLRKGKRPQRPRHWLEEGLRRFATEVHTSVRDLLGVGQTAPPEVQLVQLVAAEAGLPDDALEVPSAVYERRFVLVEGVSESMARHLAEDVRAVGFRADARPVSPDGPSRGQLAVRMVGGLAMLAMLLAFVLPDQALAWGSGILVGLVVLLAQGSWGSGGTGSSDAVLPVAFTANLREQLQPEYAARAVDTGTPPERTLAGRTHARIEALLAELEEDDRLPDIVRGDLRSTARELAERTETLGEEIARIEAELAEHTDVSAEIQRVQQRLQRLRTLERGGRTDVGGEIRELGRAMRAHQQVLQDVEAQESRLTLATARLLEIGAAVVEARRILEDQAIQTSAPDLLKRLKKESSAASSAVDEVTRQRRRQHQTQ